MEDSDPLCLPARSTDAFPQVSFDGLPQAVLDFLNQGGTLENLDQGLYEQNMANQPVAVAAEDMTGDGKLEVIVSAYDPGRSMSPPPGGLLIFTCRERKYQLAYQYPSPPAFGAPVIRYLQDLNNRDGAELVTGAVTCGAHTCFEDIQVIGWTGTRFENLLAGDTTALPYPYTDLVEGPENSSLAIEITGSGFGSVGAGPQRGLTHRYTYREEFGEWRLESEIYEPSNYRIHVLHDADRAAEEEDYPEALRLYQRVAQDPTLDDWGEPEEEQNVLGAYARFRMLVTYHHLGQPEFAAIQLREMQQEYPPTHPQRKFVEMAEIFQAEVKRSGVAGGCQAARAYAGDHPTEILERLGSTAFGYANPDYSPEDICPP